MINECQFCAAKLAKCAYLLAMLFSEKKMKIMLVVQNYAKNRASTMYQSLLQKLPSCFRVHRQPNENSRSMTRERIKLNDRWLILMGA